MTILLPPPDPHRCQSDLPCDRGGYGSTGYPDGTIARCPSCARWWLSGPCYEHYGPTSRWRPVRWYHREARRRTTEENR